MRGGGGGGGGGGEANSAARSDNSTKRRRSRKELFICRGRLNGNLHCNYRAATCTISTRARGEAITCRRAEGSRHSTTLAADGCRHYLQSIPGLGFGAAGAGMRA